MIINSTGKPLISKDMKVAKRVYRQLSDESMGSLWEAIIEFITNVDDSYERLSQLKKEKKWFGKALFEYFPGGKKNSTVLVIKDQAEGMSYETLEKCFGNYGEKQSGTASRGIAGRGAKDAASIGNVSVVSIKDGYFSQIKIDHLTRKFQVFNKNIKAKTSHYKMIGVKNGKNGTAIQLEISAEKSGYHLRTSDLIKKIPLHYALSEILHNEKKTLSLKFNSKNDQGKVLSYYEPDGELVEEQTFYINKYKEKFGEDAKVSFKLFKSKVPLDSGEGDKRFRQWGVSVIGKKAVHEKSLLDTTYDIAPEGKYYFGQLKTNLITRLLNDYDENQSNNKSATKDNPHAIIDLKRVEGLKRDHPAVEEMFRIPKDIIKKFILEDRNSAENKNIENDNTKETLDELAKECAKLMDDLYEEDDTDIQGIQIDMNQWKFIPPKQNLHVGKRKYIYAYTRKENLSSNLDTAFIDVSKGSEDCIIIHSNKVKYKESKKKKNLIYFKFEIEGAKPKKDVSINVFQKEGQIRTSLKINVLAEESRQFTNELEFEKEIYNVKAHKVKKLKIFAKVPEVLTDKMSSEDMIAKVFNVNTDHIKIVGQCKFSICGPNYAIGILQVEGRTLSANNEITIQLNGKRASAYVNVLNKEDENDDDDKSKFNFQILPNKYGKQRYQWNPQSPNSLEIAGEHDQLKRYLGKKENGYPGQETSCFKSLLAEIITEAMIQKRMTLNSRYDPSTYVGLVDKSNIEDTIMNFMFKVDEEKSIFLEKIHKILLKDSILNEEIRKFSKALN